LLLVEDAAARLVVNGAPVHQAVLVLAQPCAHQKTGANM
jgi:hypothetical protein